MAAFLFSYNAASESAKVLAAAMGIQRIKAEGSRFKGASNKVVINWGNSSMPEFITQNGTKVINKPEAVAIASNKLDFFTHIYLHNQKSRQPVNIPMIATSREDAIEMLNTGMSGLVARTKLKGSGGEGIVLIEHVDEMIDAPLYTEYLKKKSEYRVHVVGGEAIRVQRKARRKDVPDDQINWKIRNHQNGFIFAANEDLGEVPEDVTEQGIRAVQACGLDFGAVDIVYSTNYKCAYVLEINTAPGLTGETVMTYTEYMNKLVAVMSSGAINYNQALSLANDAAYQDVVAGRRAIPEPRPVGTNAWGTTFFSGAVPRPTRAR